MREILFRGKCLEGAGKGKWVYGVPVTTSGGDCYIIEDVRDYDAIGYDVKMTRVNSDTVGQYTGMMDRGEGYVAKMIFEGDILKTPKYGKTAGDKNFSGADVFEVYYEDGTYCIGNRQRAFCLRPDCLAEVIGNIYDNPELLKETQT